MTQQLRDALKEARLQIEYLHDKFSVTGSGNAALTKIDAALSAPAADTVTLRMVWREDAYEHYQLRVGGLFAGRIWHQDVDDIWYAENAGDLPILRTQHPTLSAAKFALEAAVRAMEPQP